MHVLYRWLIATSILVILLMIAQTFFYFPLIIFTRTMVSVVTATIIVHFIVNANSSTRISKVFFGNKFLLITGRISYGIYLYHLGLFSYGHKWFLPVVASLPFKFSLTAQFALYVVVNFTILFLMAFTSWKFFEQPISNLKRLFNTTPKKQEVPLAYEKAG
jgi:peptidoglycan/LPS O-acetylase OafA/YrhL